MNNNQSLDYDTYVFSPLIDWIETYRVFMSAKAKALVDQSYLSSQLAMAVVIVNCRYPGEELCSREWLERIAQLEAVGLHLGIGRMVDWVIRRQEVLPMMQTYFGDHPVDMIVELIDEIYIHMTRIKKQFPGSENVFFMDRFIHFAVDHILYPPNLSEDEDSDAAGGKEKKDG